MASAAWCYPRDQARGAKWLGAVAAVHLMVAGAGVILNGPVGSVLYWSSC
jgi:hypothetical protein